MIRSDDKKRARLAAIQTVLGRIDYAGKDQDAIGRIDDSIVGGPELLVRCPGACQGGRLAGGPPGG